MDRLADSPIPFYSQASLEASEAQAASVAIGRLKDNIKSLIRMTPKTLEHLIAAKIAGGHVILADSHGVGKTSLARALAQSISWPSRDTNNKPQNNSPSVISVDSFNRIQCTVDLLPQDILGFSRYDLSSNSLIFIRGPIFAHFVLCDEINLLTPKTQGSFFQAMEEQEISIEGNTYRLPDPFFVIATMNLKGTHLFPLPAPQLDRFMIQLSMGYPDEANEELIVKQHGFNDSWQGFLPVISANDLSQWQQMVDKIPIHEDVISYLIALIRKTRQHPEIEIGASPRAGIKISRLARALSLVRGNNWVSVDLIKEIFLPAVAHRIIMRDSAVSATSILTEVLDSVPIDRKNSHPKTDHIAELSVT